MKDMNMTKKGGMMGDKKGYELLVAIKLLRQAMDSLGGECYCLIIKGNISCLRCRIRGFLQDLSIEERRVNDE